MATFKVNKKKKNFTIMSNTHLRDERLSLKAKGLLSVMLSLPEEWHYSLGGLVSICKEGESAVNAALKELKKCGYIQLDKLRPNQTKSGKFEYIYNIYEEPLEKIQEGDFLGVENLGVENLGVENHPLYKYTNELNTDELNTDELNNNLSIHENEVTEDDIKLQICYNNFNDSRLDEIVILIKDVLNSKSERIQISKELRSTNEVKQRFKQINNTHIDYVLECLNNNSTEIKNIKAYILSCLYNSTLTINNYYYSKVQHDLR